MKKIDYRLLCKAVLISLIPFALCVIVCLTQGGSISKVFLPNSQWNDEVFYFKQVEGIINYGFPQGFFGFNESHARLFSFSAWSPALYVPWSLWGRVFGWNLMSPVIANIVFLSVALFITVILIKPDLKQTIFFAVILLCFRSSARYMLSVVPETICHSFAILITALGISYQDKESNAKLTLMFILSGYAFLMRPYMGLFIFLPMFFLCKKKKGFGVFLSLVIGLVTLGLYYFISKYLQADYFGEIIRKGWIRAFFERGFAGGVKNLIDTLRSASEYFFKEIGNYFKAGRPQGAYCFVYIGTAAVLLLHSVDSVIRTLSLKRSGKREEYEKQKRSLPVTLHMTICFAAMYAALLLMYDLQPGARHFLVYISAAMIVLVRISHNMIPKFVAAVALFAVGFWVRPMDPYEIKVPFVNEEAIGKREYWTETFDREIELNTDDTPNYDNTVLWVYTDEKDSETILSDWTSFYYLPKGMGISCTQASYAAEHFDSLRSRYIMVPKGGMIDALCVEHGYTLIGEYEGNKDSAMVYLNGKQ